MSKEEWVEFSKNLADVVDSTQMHSLVFNESSKDKTLSAQIDVVKFTNYTKFSNENDGFYNIGAFINQNAVDSCILVKKNNKLELYLEELHIGIMNLDFKVYDSCKRLVPNVLVVSSDMIPIMILDDKFKITAAISNKSIYECGTYENKKVYVSEELDVGTIVGMVVHKMMSAIGISNTEDKFSFEVINKNLMQKMKVID